MQMTKMSKVSIFNEIISYCFSQKARTGLKKAKSFEKALGEILTKQKTFVNLTISKQNSKKRFESRFFHIAESEKMFVRKWFLKKL